MTRRVLALAGALLVSLSFASVARANAFIKAYGWGVSDGMSQFETCTTTCQAGLPGGGAGQLEDPADVATDSFGDVYVADPINDRVDEFSAAGAFIKAYGWGVSDGTSRFETCTTTCQSGISGAGAGQFDHPTGIATDSSGDVYVADYYNERIDEFSASGAFIKAYGWGVNDGTSQFETCTSSCETGEAGGGAGQLDEPYGVATDSSGDVYVADYANERIDEFSSAGAFIKAYGWGVSDGASSFETCTSSCQAGVFGDGAGQFDEPEGVATNPSGDVYVGENNDSRIDEFSAAGAFIKAYGWGVSDGGSSFETCTTTCQRAIAGDGAGQFGSPDSVAADPSGNVYVDDSINQRIDEFSSAGAFIRAWGWGVSDGMSKFETCTSTCQAGIDGSGAGQLNYPSGIATDSFGDIYVADAYSQRIDEFSAFLSTVVDDAATDQPWSGSAIPRASAYDTATVSGTGVTPTGTVTYSFFVNGGCSGTPASTDQVTLSGGNVPNSSATGPLAAGSYSFGAAYTGNYPSSSSSCEPFTVLPLPAPSNISSPTISGSAVNGQTLTGGHGSWSNDPTSYSYQWEGCDSSGGDCSAISGATGETYKLTGADVGHTIRVLVYAANAGGTSAPASSAASAVVQPSVTAIKPSEQSLPVINGTSNAGRTLSCSTGSWTNNPTDFLYQWSFDGTPIVGAAHSTYPVQTIDEGLTLTCTVTAINAAGAGKPATSKGRAVPVPHVARCPAATGKLSGTTLGLLHLGMTRAQARHAYTHSSTRGFEYKDFFCLTPRGVRVGYASPKLLKTLPGSERKQLAARVIWASTSNAFYAVHGVRPGASVAAADMQLTLEAPFHIGLNYWYLAPNGASTAVLKVRHGVVEEIGIGAKSLTQGREAQRRFMTSFS